MDGRQVRMSQSLQFRLSLWLSLTIVLVAAAAGFLSYGSAFYEAIEFRTISFGKPLLCYSASFSPRHQPRSRDRQTRIQSPA